MVRRETQAIFLLSRFTKFFERVIELVANSDEVEYVSVVYWSNDHLPVVPELDALNISLNRRSEFTDDGLSLSEGVDYLVYVPGWMDKGYLEWLKNSRKNYSVITCVGFDDQWHWNFRQIVGSVYFRLRWKNLIDYAWIAGSPQYLYARMFGFSNEEMIYNLLTSSYSKSVPSLAGKHRPKKVVFVGRLVKEKNLKMLLNCFDDLGSDKLELHIIGDGELREELEQRQLNRVVFHGFQSSSRLQKTLNTYDAFILPSVHEQWSVSVHEAALSGLLLLSSMHVGANSEFLIEGFNGFTFDPSSEKELTQLLVNLAEMSDEQLMAMKSNSLVLSTRRNLLTTAASFLSMKYKKSAIR